MAVPRRSLQLILIFPVLIHTALSQCPPKDALSHCECSLISDTDSPEKVKIVCDGAILAEISSKLKAAGLMDLTIQNSDFKTIPKDVFSGLKIGKLSLINNGLQRLPAGSFQGVSPNIRELFIKEEELQLIEDLAFNDLTNVQNITVTDAHSLERIPKLKGFPALAAIGFLDTSVRYLEAGTLSDLPNLREINLRDNKIEIFDMRTFGELPSVTKLDLTGNKLVDISFLPLFLRTLPSLHFLFLQYNLIQDIPLGFLDGLPAILLLDFRHNKIAKLPERLVTANSSPLRELYLGQNYITDLPTHLFENVTGLKTLSLANNSIGSLNLQLAPLKDLLYLRLEGNRLQRIAGDAFRTLSRLQIISLENNQITVLENGVFAENEALLTIDLSRNQLQDFRGTEIKKSPKLENLLFAGNRLRNLYAGFESLVSLKRLDFSNNEISNIDDYVFSNLKSLENLQLDGNLLSKIPLGALQKLTALERLSLGANRIHFLSAFKPIGHLKYLSLDRNVLQNIDAGIFSQLSELRQLLLNDNHISVIQPKAFAELYTLYVLDLSDNMIDTMPAKVLDNLLSLETVDLSFNELEKLGEGTLGNLPSLRSADFSHNKIAIVSEKAFTNVPHLVQLNISKNLVNVVPINAGILDKLRKLDLSENRIRRITENDFSKLGKLENLFLQRNPICFMAPKAFTAFQQLSNLDLSYTDIRHIPQNAFKSDQDFSKVNLEGLNVECDCNVKWLRTIKGNLKCGYPGAVSAMKISQINLDILPCPKDGGNSGEECSVLPVASRAPRTGTESPIEPKLFTTENPDSQILAKGSVTKTWLTHSEHEAKAEELAAIQAAKQTRNLSGANQMKCGSVLWSISPAVFLLLGFYVR